MKAKIKDLVKISSVAAGTAAVTLVTCWSGSIDAGPEGDALAAKIAKPKLVCQGVEMTVDAAEDHSFKPREKPEFKLMVVNTTGVPATVPVRMVMSSTSPGDALSRVVRMPAILWQEERSIVLKPHETKAALFSTKTALPANSLISVSIEEVGANKGQAAKSADLSLSNPRMLRPAKVIALSFSTVTGIPNARLALSR